MFKLAPIVLLAFSGCLGPGQAYSPAPAYSATQGYAPPGQQLTSPPPAQAQAAEEAPPDNLSYALAHEVRDIVPQDEEWCRNPAVAAAIMEAKNAPLVEGARHIHDLLVGYGRVTPDSPVDYHGRITGIDDMTAGLHRCARISREACDDVGHTHVCRGVVHMEGRTPVPALFTITGDDFTKAGMQQD